MDPLSRLLDDARQQGVFPAAQALVWRDGAVVFDAAVGEADETTLFDLSSLTKALSTAILAHRHLDLDTRAATLAQGVDDRLTVRHLLEHSAGYPAHRRFDRFQSPSRDRILALAAATPLDAEPGTRALYSDIGFIVLGGILEKATGRPLDALFTDEIADPTGADVHYGVPPGRTVAPCESRRGVVHDDNARAMGGVAGHAGLFGTSRGVLTIARSLLDGAALLAPATRDAMWARSAVPGSTRTAGWDMPAPRGSSAGERWPKTAVGHLGFTGTSVWIDPESRRVGILLTNRPDQAQHANPAVRALRPRFYDLAWSAAMR